MTALFEIELPALKELGRALVWPLRLLTAVIALSLAGSFIPYEQVERHGHPWLPRLTCAGCPFCGMTRSFCAMSDGKLTRASEHNEAGPWLYAGCWIWTGAALARARPERFKSKRRDRLLGELS